MLTKEERLKKQIKDNDLVFVYGQDLSKEISDNPLIPIPWVNQLCIFEGYFDDLLGVTSVFTGEEYTVSIKSIRAVYKSCSAFNKIKELSE